MMLMNDLLMKEKMRE